MRPRAFCLIEGLVGGRYEVGRDAQFGRTAGDADTGRHRLVRKIGMLDVAAYTLGDRRGLSPWSGQQDGKLFAAKTRGHIGAPKGFANDAADDL